MCWRDFSTQAQNDFPRIARRYHRRKALMFRSSIFKSEPCICNVFEISNWISVDRLCRALNSRAYTIPVSGHREMYNENEHFGWVKLRVTVAACSPSIASCSCIMCFYMNEYNEPSSVVSRYCIRLTFAPMLCVSRSSSNSHSNIIHNYNEIISVFMLK